MSDDLVYMSAGELLGHYRSGRLSPVEVTRAILDRIERLNPRLNAYCLVDAEAALAAAAASEARWRRQAPQGVLDGVPTSIKDLVLTRGWPTRRGSHTIDPDQPWDEDAPVTALLRRHGAVLIGKTTTPEFGWKAVTDSPLTGISYNPWNLALTPGGSSGGAAAQVAAGLGPLAIGTDGGGSIRIPASFCGIVGLKPSFGRVPAWPLSPFGTLAHVGPMARTVADAALMLTAISEPDPRDWFQFPDPGGDWSAGLDGGIAGLKVAFSPRLGYARVAPEVAALVAAAAQAFAELGATVEEVDPGFASPREMFWRHWTVGAFNALRTLDADKRRLLDRELDAAIDIGGRTSLGEYLDAVNGRGALGIHMKAFHQTYDLLLTPTLAVTAFGAGRLHPEAAEQDPEWTHWTPFSYPFNLTQQPAITLPCGFTGEGLPVGLQIVGPMHRDDLVLRAARAYEAAHPFTNRRPALA